MKKKLLLLLMLIVTSVTSWAADPYFEVLSGSFATKDAEVKVTFPGVTTVELSNYIAIYDDSSILTTVSNFTVTGNEITFSMDPSGYYANEPGDDPTTIRLWFYSGHLSLDGTPTTCNVYSLEAQPYAEIVGGSIASGNVTIRVTVPYATALTVSNSSVLRLLYDGNNIISDIYSDITDLTTTAKTFTATYKFTPPGNDPTRYAVAVTIYSYSPDGEDFNDHTVVFPVLALPCAHDNITHHDAVDPTRTTTGNLAYDECDDCGALFLATDLGHENAVEWSAIELPVLPPPYFWVENRGSDFQINETGMVHKEQSRGICIQMLHVDFIHMKMHLFQFRCRQCFQKRQDQ